MDTALSAAAEAAAVLASKTGVERHDIALILGSGWGGAADLIGEEVASVEAGEIPLQFSADGAALFVYRPTALPARVYRVTLATGQRELWRELTAADPAGVYKIAPVVITPDANGYAYTALRVLSELYLTEGVY